MIADALVVLLGSIATNKYCGPLLRIFGERLVFPREFVGRGDMSRGGLLLRCVREGRPLDYVPVLGATRHGARPPRLTRLPRPLLHRAAIQSLVGPNPQEAQSRRGGRLFPRAPGRRAR